MNLPKDKAHTSQKQRKSQNTPFDNFRWKSLALALSAALLTSANAGTITIDFDGNRESDWSKVKRTPQWAVGWFMSASLYSETSSSSNTIKVKNLGIPSSQERSYGVFGGIAKDRSDRADNNNVIIDEVLGSTVYGGYSNVSASHNTVEVLGNVSYILSHPETGEFIRSEVMGGHAANSTGVLGNQANDNKVIVRGNVHSDIVGGAAISSAHDNSITIYGDYDHQMDRSKWATGITGGTSAFGDAIGNSITMHGNLLAGIVMGGFSVRGSATNNSVTIIGEDAIGSGEIEIYGGADAKSSGASVPFEALNVFTGNTLNFKAGSLAAKTIANFEHYNFTLDPKLRNSEIALITADEIMLGNRDESEASKVNVVGIKQGDELFVDDKFLLMKSNNMTGIGEGDVFRGVAQQGISILYDVETIVDVENGEAIAIILGNEKENPENETPAGRINPQLKALSEGNLAELMLLTRGADIVAYDLFDTIKEQEEGWFVPFVKMGGGHHRYDSGSHFKSNDFFLMTGLSYRNDGFAAAAFVEAGWGDYDTRNSFIDAANVDGDGKSRYVGVGVLGKYDFANGVYVDGSFRIGSSHNKFNTSDIRNLTTGEEARYSFSRTYVSAHAGLGYIYDIDSTNAIDFSAKYLWTHLGSKNLTVAGDNLKFKSLDSNRVQLRATWNHQANDSIKLKAGVGYEYEFSAKAKATALDMYSVNAPSVKGGTGIATLGINVNPESNRRLDVDFNINGYVGKRQGVNANIKVSYNF